MTTKISEFRREQQITSVRLAQGSNLSGTYSNGSSNNGIGATLTTASSSLTVDSVVTRNGDRILLINQTNSYENGIYIVSGVGSAVVLTRTYDAQSPDQFEPGYYVPVEAGTAYGGAIFNLIEPQVQVIGVDDILFTDSSSSPIDITLSNDGLNIYDTNATHTLTISPGSNLTANRTFSLVTGDADRSLTLSGDSTINQDVSTAGSPAFTAITVANSGLHVLDTNASHDLVITPGSDLTADRILTLTTGDAARTLDISAASVTVSAFGATLVDDATKLVSQATLGIKSATTAAYAGGGTSNAFVATGLVSTDIVVATILASTNSVSICKAVPTADTLTITFSADPGAATTVQWHAIATV
jgi:hypothetical protein